MECVYAYVVPNCFYSMDSTVEFPDSPCVVVVCVGNTRAVEGAACAIVSLILPNLPEGARHSMR